MEHLMCFDKCVFLCNNYPHENKKNSSSAPKSFLLPPTQVTTDSTSVITAEFRLFQKFIKMESYSMSPFESGFFHSTSCLQNASLLLNLSVV